MQYNKISQFCKLESIIIALSLLLLTGCGEKDGSDYLFRYSILSDPQTLDPQLATDKSSLIVIENMMDGLLGIGVDGQLVPAVADSYTISPDELTYTFSIRSEAYWMGASLEENEKITPNDFVFTFQRLFDPNTNSPYASSFTCIKNADKILQGLLPTTQLGVTVGQNDTVVFELEYPCSQFLWLLTTTPAMPCKESFFYDAKGKYGLTAESTMSSGAFYLKEWEYDLYGKNNYLIMRRNTARSAYDRVFPSSLNFFIEGVSEKKISSNSSEPPKQLSKQETAIQNFSTGGTDALTLSDTLMAQYPKLQKENNVSIHSYPNVSYGLVFSQKAEHYFRDKDFRKGLALSIQNSMYRGELSSHSSPTVSSMIPAGSIIPPAVTILNKSFREMAAEQLIPRPDVAANAWKDALGRTAKFSASGEVTLPAKNTLDGIKILIPFDFPASDALHYVTQQWQSNLNFFCGLEIVNNDEYNMRLSDGRYDMALIRLDGGEEQNLAASFITPLVDLLAVNIPPATTEIPEEIPTEPSNTIDEINIVSQLNSLLLQADKAATLNDSIKLYQSAESLLIDNFEYLPLFYSNTYLLTRDSMEDIILNPFTGQVSFSKAKKY